MRSRLRFYSSIMAGAIKKIPLGSSGTNCEGCFLMAPIYGVRDERRKAQAFAGVV